MVRVKICGITNREDAFAAVDAGAWALGFVFYKKSPRYISPSRAQKIIRELPPFVTPVGLFVNHKEGALKDITDFCQLHTVQLHGDESAMFCRRIRKTLKVIKAFRVQEGFNFRMLADYQIDACLFDAYSQGQFGGTGKAFDWNMLKNSPDIRRPVILSGGLTPENVNNAISAVRPFAVDVSSGVEKSPGKKDFKLLQTFIQKAFSYA